MVESISPRVLFPQIPLEVGNLAELNKTESLCQNLEKNKVECLSGAINCQIWKFRALLEEEATERKREPATGWEEMELGVLADEAK